MVTVVWTTEWMETVLTTAWTVATWTATVPTTEATVKETVVTVDKACPDSRLSLLSLPSWHSSLPRS
jgi:hypothetical protein